MPSTSLPCRHHLQKLSNTVIQSSKNEGISGTTMKRKKITSSYFSDRSKSSKSTKIKQINSKEKTPMDEKDNEISSKQPSEITSVIRSILDSYYSDQKKNSNVDEKEWDENNKSNNIKDGMKVKQSKKYITRSGWCLLQGLVHIISEQPKLLPLLQKHGPPPFYASSVHYDQDTTGHNEYSFQPLCRIIVGQQLGGAAASSIWSRFTKTVQKEQKKSKQVCTHMISNEMKNQNFQLRPQSVLNLITYDEKNDIDWDKIDTQIRKPAGLSKAKIRSIIDLAKFYERGELSDDLLFYHPSSPTTSVTASLDCLQHKNDTKNMKETLIKSRLLKVNGIGPWTCDMFLMFHSHQSNILPIGDLGIRKGTTLFFGVKGKGKNGVLCDKKDLSTIKNLHRPFEPYQSISSYYMWKFVDTVDFQQDA